MLSRDMNPTIASAKAAEAAGADIIVATGCDEGGGMPSHATGTLSAVLLAKNAVNIPVLAAGGINTASNVAGLIKSIDSCEDIVSELGAAF